MYIDNHQRAEVITQALPYIQKYHDKIIVVKYGGNAMISEDLKMQVMEDIVLLSLIGVKPVLVHGGGPEISDMRRSIDRRTAAVEPQRRLIFRLDRSHTSGERIVKMKDRRFSHGQAHLSKKLVDCKRTMQGLDKQREAKQKNPSCRCDKMDFLNSMIEIEAY